MLAPRDAATDEEASDLESGSEIASTRSAESEDEEETAAVKGETTIEGHALDIGDSPLVSEDDSSTAEPTTGEEQPKETPAESKAEVDAASRGPRPFDVPVVGDFYMHDDRSTGAAKATPAPRTGGYMRSRRGEGINANRWKHDKFEELEKEFQGRAGKGSRPYDKEIPTQQGRWMKNSHFPPSRAPPGMENQFHNLPAGERGRGRFRGGARGYRGRGRGYSGRFGHQLREHAYEHRS